MNDMFLSFGRSLVEGVISGGAVSAAAIGTSMSQLSDTQASFLASLPDLGLPPVTSGGGMGFGFGVSVRCGSTTLMSFGAGGGGGFGGLGGGFGGGGGAQ